MINVSWPRSFFLSRENGGPSHYKILFSLLVKMTILNLKHVLEQKFPEEERIDLFANILSEASHSSSKQIRYEKIKALGGTEDDLYLLFMERLLLPVRTSKSMAWEDRVPLPKPGEKYEMPNVIQYLIKRAEKTGKWEPNYAIKKYLEEIKEPRVKELLKLLQRLKKKILESKTLSKTNKITVQHLKEFSKNLELDLNKTIAELKGGGIISPCLHNLKYGLRYEINQSLLK